MAPFGKCLSVAWEACTFTAAPSPTSACMYNAEEKRNAFKPRPRATMACVKTSALRNGRATSEWLASICTWVATTVRLQQLKPLTRQSCCAMSTAVMARLLCLLSPTSLLSTTRFVCLPLTAVACVSGNGGCSRTAVSSDSGSMTCQGGLSLEDRGSFGVLRSCALILVRAHDLRVHATGSLHLP